MSFLDRLFKRKSTVETETKPQSTPETEIPRVETETDKIDLILKDLSSISLFLRLHDKRLVEHDKRISDYLVELLTQRKLITPEKREEVEEVIKEALKLNTPKSEVVDKLTSLGVPRSTAFKYAKPIQSKPETENLQPETET